MYEEAIAKWFKNVSDLWVVFGDYTRSVALDEPKSAFRQYFILFFSLCVTWLSSFFWQCGLTVTGFYLPLCRSNVCVCYLVCCVMDENQMNLVNVVVVVRKIFTPFKMFGTQKRKKQAHAHTHKQSKKCRVVVYIDAGAGSSNKIKWFVIAFYCYKSRSENACGVCVSVCII